MAFAALRATCAVVAAPPSLAAAPVAVATALRARLSTTAATRQADAAGSAGSAGSPAGKPPKPADELPERPPGSPQDALDRIVWEIAKLSEPTWKSTAAPVDPNKSYHDPKLRIDPALEGQYQFGITPEEIKDRAPWVQRAFSFHTANQPEINRLRIHQAISQFQQRKGDTGSTEVQVAVLTTKIAYLTEHIKKNRNDLHSRRGLEMMVAQRRRLLKYLRSQSMQRYGTLIRKLGIRAM